MHLISGRDRTIKDDQAANLASNYIDGVSTINLKSNFIVTKMVGANYANTYICITYLHLYYLLTFELLTYICITYLQFALLPAFALLTYLL